MITLEPFNGHIVLYCKGWYNQKEVNFLVGLRRIWAIRCGYDYNENDKSVDEYIANRLYDIIVQTNPKIDLVNFQKKLHSELADHYWSSMDRDLNTIERIIKFYRSQIFGIAVKEEGKFLIHLPKPEKRVFARIIKGKGKYDDYKLIQK